MDLIDPKRVAFDIDGVVADTMRLFLDIAQSRHGIDHIAYEDITCYHLDECLEIDGPVLTDVITCLLEGRYQSVLSPIDDAPQVLHRMARDHAPLFFVTARPDAQLMQRWFSETLALAPAQFEIVATGAYEAKRDVLLDRGVTHFVEDRLETCFFLQEEGISPVVFKQPWNRVPHPFTEVSTWQELSALIDW